VVLQEVRPASNSPSTSSPSGLVSETSVRVPSVTVTVAGSVGAAPVACAAGA
jgi:hypothetical protein